MLNKFNQILSFILNLFPVWVVLFSVLALFYPALFIELKVYIIPLLMLVMLGMGLTLRWQDFVQVWQHRFAVGLGVIIQFLVMPFAAFVLAKLFNLSTELTIGLMLVGTTAGGTASNVIAYLAKGDLALSVSMTLVSTLLAVVAMPVLTWVYLGQSVEVPVESMLLNLLKIIVAPILIGVLINHYFGVYTQKVVTIFPVFSMAVIVLIVAIVVALNQNRLEAVASLIILAVILHNAIGLLAGYFLSKLFGQSEKVARTVAIEVGMQNSGLSVALALKYYGAASAIPGALFSIWHNVSGAALASWWRRR